MVYISVILHYTLQIMEFTTEFLQQSFNPNQCSPYNCFSSHPPTHSPPIFDCHSTVLRNSEFNAWIHKPQSGNLLQTGLVQFCTWMWITQAHYSLVFIQFLYSTLIKVKVMVLNCKKNHKILLVLLTNGSLNNIKLQ